MVLLVAACSSDDDAVDTTTDDGTDSEQVDTTDSTDATDDAESAASDGSDDATDDGSDAVEGDDAAGDDGADDATDDGAQDSTDTEGDDGSDEADSSTASASVDGCDEVAALFTTDGSANPDMADPESSAVCDGDTIVISSNAIPDYTYIETSPGPPRAQDLTYTIPADPTVAAETTDVPLIGSLGVTLAGIPIFGPTEGTGGDVGSLPGILMECGGHNGPSGFHLHVVGTSETTDCDFSAEELASGPQLLGYAFDGYPIYTGNAQYQPSWELTDESLFATDTWAAHTYVEGSGDLDECNGRTDENGNYAYYTTDAFPYIIGCFVGEVELTGPGGGGGGPGGDDAAGERPARPEGGERPAREDDEDRPEPADG
ncbi:MAG: YHYH protein [Actinomycetota bacterium]